MEIRGQAGSSVGVWEVAARGLGQGAGQGTGCSGDMRGLQS